MVVVTIGMAFTVWFPQNNIHLQPNAYSWITNTLDSKEKYSVEYNYAPAKKSRLALNGKNIILAAAWQVVLVMKLGNMVLLQRFSTRKFPIQP